MDNETTARCLICDAEACCDGLCAKHYNNAVNAGIYDNDYLEEFPDDDYRAPAREENM